MTPKTEKKTQWKKEFELEHLNRRRKCLACEKMYRYSIEVLESQNKLLLEMLRDKHLSEKITMKIPAGVKLI